MTPLPRLADAPGTRLERPLTAGESGFVPAGVARSWSARPRTGPFDPAVLDTHTYPFLRGVIVANGDGFVLTPHDNGRPAATGAEFRAEATSRRSGWSAH